MGAWVVGRVHGLQVVCVGCRVICYCSSSTTEAAQHRLAPARVACRSLALALALALAQALALALPLALTLNLTRP